ALGFQSGAFQSTAFQQTAGDVVVQPHPYPGPAGGVGKRYIFDGKKKYLNGIDAEMAMRAMAEELEAMLLGGPMDNLPSAKYNPEDRAIFMAFPHYPGLRKKLLMDGQNDSAQMLRVVALRLIELGRVRRRSVH